MWEYCDGYWLLAIFPIITVRPLVYDGGGVLFHAFCGGLLVEQVQSDPDAEAVKANTLEYFDARIDLVSTERVEQMMKERIVYV